MAGIILTILKIIGIILLVVVGIVLTLAGIILFWPIRYRVSAYKEIEEIKATVDITWIFRLIRCRAVYEKGKEFFYYVKIAFFQILPVKEKKIEKKQEKPEREKTDKEKSDKEEQSKENEKKENQPEEVSQKVQKQPKEATTEKKQSATSKEKRKSDLEKDASQSKKQKTKEKLKEEARKERKSFFEKIEEKIQQIKSTFQNICDKVKKISSTLENLKAFLTSEETKEALRFLNEQRKYVFRRFKPDKFQIDTRFGTEDPALTGELLAAYSVAYPFLPGTWNVTPNFEQVCFDGKLYLKGKIQLYVLLVVGLRCYKNKTIGKFINIVKR